jgi:hypothetical protein
MTYKIKKIWDLLVTNMTNVKNTYLLKENTNVSYTQDFRYLIHVETT